MPYEDCVRTVGMTTVETRRLRVDMIEVFKFLISFEGTEVANIFQRRVGATRGHDWKMFKKRVNLDGGN